jgi:hypothetical protein
MARRLAGNSRLSVSGIDKLLSYLRVNATGAVESVP